jgi:hypothetical protein
MVVVDLEQSQRGHDTSPHLFILFLKTAPAKSPLSLFRDVLKEEEEEMG